MSEKFYITTAIAYTSRKPHIGNTYDIVLADMIARYKRLRGYDVYFMTGSDEHGQKIEEYAKVAGITPKEYVDNVSSEIKAVWDSMHTSYDKFIRTTDADHEAVVKKIFNKLYEQGDIYKGCYEGKYCVPCESFYTASQLKDGKCPDCGGDVTDAKEEAYFLKLSKYQKQLEEYIENNDKFIYPEARKKEMLNNFIKPGLQDLCVSRTSFKWGIPVTFDDKHVIYVWIDALSNYITAIGYDPDGSSDLYKKLWPANVHIIGKDIVRFHTIYWPIMLMALDVPLPKQIFGHPWLLLAKNDKQEVDEDAPVKMSKSRGNVIYADDLVDMFGVDATRYFVLHEMPYDNDGTITWELVVERYNSDLANILGNLVSRTISMSNKYFDGFVNKTGVTEAVDEDLKLVATSCRDKVTQKMDSMHIADALSEVMALFRRCNKYIDETEPWVLAKDESKKDRLSEVLYNLVESICIGANLLKPFMPETADKILMQLRGTERDYDLLDEFGLCDFGTKVTDQPEMLFARLDLGEVMAKVEKIREAQKAEYERENGIVSDDSQEEVINVEVKPEISYDDFAKLQFVVGEILECKEVPKSKKLLCSQVKVGNQVKQIVSGIKQYYKPEEMVGKKVMVLLNLKPATLAGVVSEGMLLCAEDAEGNLALVSPEKDMPSGAEIC